jgi:hypothetical protein
MLQAYKSRCTYGLVIVECITNTKHGPVIHDQNEHKYRQEHQIIASVIPDPETKRLVTYFYAGGCGDFLFLAHTIPLPFDFISHILFSLKYPVPWVFASRRDRIMISCFCSFCYDIADIITDSVQLSTDR